MSRVADNELRQAGISMMQFVVLVFVLNAKEQVTSTRISHGLFRESHTVCQLLMCMETQSLVKRAKDLDRKNIVRITLTDK